MGSAMIRRQRKANLYASVLALIISLGPTYHARAREAGAEEVLGYMVGLVRSPVR
jgi:hypothetical protein